MAPRTEGELRGLRRLLGSRLVDGQADEVMAEALAAFREGARLALGADIDDEGLAAGAALASARAVDMPNAENRKLISALPAYLRVLFGENVHMATVDDTLARRTSRQMAGLFDILGLRVGLLSGSAIQHQRRHAYDADVTYGTYLQFGFDYLRDNLAFSSDECVQHGHHIAIVDEVDSILVDQADEVMAISAPLGPEAERYRRATQAAAALERAVHYKIDEDTGEVSLTDAGVAEAASALRSADDEEIYRAMLTRYVEDAIRAREWYECGRDYTVVDGEIAVAERPDSRLRRVSRYDQGIRQAVEAREGLRISDEIFVLTRVVVRDYFRMYTRLSGTSASAAAVAGELEHMYQLEVVRLQPRPSTRVDHTDVLYDRARTRLAAVVDAAAERHARGQPVLIRTLTAEDARAVSEALDERRVRCVRLRPGLEEDTARVMARAGQSGAVTVLEGVTARGYDVRLGGDAAALLDEELRSRGVDVGGPEVHALADAEQAANDDVAAAAAVDRERVIGAGGLAVLSARHHASSRADDWLRGLAGRRGEPGESRFFLSMEDRPLRGLDSKVLRMLPRRLLDRADGAPAGRLVARVVADAQRNSERSRSERRMEGLAFEDVESVQRAQIYAERREFRDGSDLRNRTVDLIDQVVDAYTEKYQEPEALLSALGGLYQTGLGADDLVGEGGDRGSGSARLRARLRADAHAAYGRREATLGTSVMRELERQGMLSVLDDNWRQHLAELDAIRDGLASGRKGQGDLVLDYRREADKRYQAMRARVRERAVGLLFNIELS